MKREFSTILDLSRWLAALLVVVSHVRHLILLDLKHVVHPSLAIKGLYFFTGFGHEAVVIFFVISGYLVGGVTLERWTQSGVDFRHFFAARISRIFTVLIPALIAGFALDWIGLHFANLSELYTNANKYHTISLDNSIESSISFSAFVGNVIMLEGIASPILGTNRPLWSLVWEWWYYCLFALCAGCCLIMPTRHRILLAISAVILAACLPAKLVLWASIWLIGLILHHWIQLAKFQPNGMAGMLLFLAAMAVSRMTHNIENLEHPESLMTEFSRDLIVAVAYAVMLAGLSRRAPRIPLVALHEGLASFSYTTYLFHFPVMVMLIAAGFQFVGIDFCVQPNVGGISYFAVLTIVVYLSCLLFSRATEAHTGMVRNWLKRRAPFQPRNAFGQEMR